MTYQQAYELINVALRKYDISFPYGESLKNSLIDPIVRDLGVRLIRKRDFESFITTATDEYVITKSNFYCEGNGKVLKVQLDEKRVPFIDKSAMIEGADDVLNIGYFIDKDVAVGTITSILLGSDTIIRSANHGLQVGDYVIFSEIVGVLSAANAKSELNGIRHRVKTLGGGGDPDEDAFQIELDTTGYTAYSSGGIWQEDTKKIKFTKETDAGVTLKVHYYAQPEPRNNIRSRIDLPDTLVKATIHYVISEILDLDSKFQVASGYRGLARKFEEDYFVAAHANASMPDIIPPALGSDWIY